MRSKLTSGCSFAETGQVILSTEFIKEKHFWKEKATGAASQKFQHSESILCTVIAAASCDAALS